MTAPLRHTFPVRERLKSRKLIESLFRSGKTFSIFPFRVFYLWEESAGGGPGPGLPGLQEEVPPVQPFQIGVGAAKRNFKRAVDRNRIKRLLREGYRLQKQILHTPAAGARGLRVFILYTGRELPEFPLVLEKMGVILKKLNGMTAPEPGHSAPE